MTRAARRLPELGPHGEGWVALQLLLYAAVAIVGVRGRRWSPAAARLLRPVAAGLALVGTGLMGSGAVALGRAMTPNPRPREGAGLREGGAYALVRHPVYGGVVLGALAWALWLSPTALAPTALTAAFLDLKARREEAWLEERHTCYGDYRARVRRRFLPALW
ncbi:MAG TPA: isoprenylcysteine carboxylmethyltransferase family protein [Actinomycetota bacterium]|nr:isoprenylcysteine carboxylmethyltransferase family protein [Actinomycetota bacterium]